MSEDNGTHQSHSSSPSDGERPASPVASASRKIATDNRQAPNDRQTPLPLGKRSTSGENASQSNEKQGNVSGTESRSLSQTVNKRQRDQYVWDGMGGYMEAKNQKLRKQFSQEFSHAPESEKKRLFRDVTVWIDGATKPSREELRAIIGNHGGRYETYLTPGMVTHIVAQQLAHATRLRLQKMVSSKRAHVVKPDWILDSVNSGKLLPVADYALDGMNDPSQKSIRNFFGKTK